MPMLFSPLAHYLRNRWRSAQCSELAADNRLVGGSMKGRYNTASGTVF
jgi:hypothetical protein